MNLILHLVAGLPDDPETTASVAGDVLTIDGTAYDVSGIPEGGEAVAGGESPFVGPLTRQGGVISAGVVWRYDARVSSDNQGAVPPVVSVSAGDVVAPILRNAGGGVQ